MIFKIYEYNVTPNVNQKDVVSIFLGGSIYLINDSLGYEVNSFIFINNGYSINLLILLIISPLIIFLYIKEFLKLKKKLNTTYNIIIKLFFSFCK